MEEQLISPEEYAQQKEEKRQRRFHEQMTIFALDVDRAYLDAGRALNATRINDKDTQKLLAGWMETLSQIQGEAQRLRDKE